MAQRIRPTIRLLFACDDATYEIDTSRWVLTNPWYAVALPPGATFPFRADEFWVYVQLSGGSGAFDLAIEMRHLTDDQGPRVVGWSPTARVEFPAGDRLQVIDTAFGLKHVPFREEGLYEIRVLAEGDQPGTWLPRSGSICELRVLDPRNRP